MAVLVVVVDVVVACVKAPVAGTVLLFVAVTGVTLVLFVESLFTGVVSVPVDNDELPAVVLAVGTTVDVLVSVEVGVVTLAVLVSVVN